MKKLNLLLLVISMIIASVQAQQIKSLDEIDAASFQAGPAPFDKKSVTVNLSEKSIKHANAPLEILLDGEWQLIEGGSDNERLNVDWANPIKAVVPGSVHSALWKRIILRFDTSIKIT